MKTQIMDAYTFYTSCEDCKRQIPVYYMLADGGYTPTMMKCKNCGTLYLYFMEDTFYVKPLAEQVKTKHCVTCNEKLYDTLTPTHKSIKCCGQEFDLDENFDTRAGYDAPTTKVKVYLLYSE